MNKIDYNKIFEQTARGNAGKKLLLHCCCAPCTLGVIERVTEFFDVTLYWYNPNIMPRQEHDLRLGELRRVADIYGVELVEDVYDNERFVTATEGMHDLPEGARLCTVCIGSRIEAAARYASDNGYDYFCTTLSVSPHKDAQRINALGYEICAKYGVKWLPGDFKKRNGYKRSIELSNEYGLYRQDYCGCLYSKAR